MRAAGGQQMPPSTSALGRVQERGARGREGDAGRGSLSGVGAERKAGRRASWGTWQQEQRPRGARARHVRGRLEGGGHGGHEA